MDTFKMGLNLEHMFEFPYPNGLTLKRENEIASEVKAANGTVYADIVGWRFADTTFNWSTLDDNQLSDLIWLTGEGGSVLMQIVDPFIGQEVTLEAVRISVIATKTRLKDKNDKIVWKDVSCEFRFPRCYKEEYEDAYN